MLLFKTSGDTLDNVIRYQKHAFDTTPKSFRHGEIILVSKNKSDCAIGEAQIQFIMQLGAIRNTTYAEIERYWPGHGNRWENGIIVDCRGTVAVPRPFNLATVIGPAGSQRYRPIQKYGKIDDIHEALIMRHLAGMGIV